jgi:cytochrome c-type biogenesis protein CcmH
MILGIVLTLMTLGAAALVVIPLLRANRATATRGAHEIEIYRDQLNEVERDVERGMITADEAEAARTEISRRMLAANAGNEGGGETASASGTSSPFRGTRITAIFTGIAVPVLAIGVYLTHGSPDLPGRPAVEMREAARSGAQQARVGNSAGDAAQRAAVTELAAALEKNPADLEKWVALGDTLTGMKRHRQAAIAYSQAMQLAPENADYASRTGEALTFAAASQVTPGAVAAFSEALRRDPRDARAQYYIGLADQQGGRLRAALDRWVVLEAASPPDAPWLKFLRPRIARIAGELGVDRNALAAMRERAPKAAEMAAPESATGERRGPTREQMQAAQNMTAEDRQAMIRNMVNGLAERLKENPDDISGWLRLGRARTVLGDKAAARDAYAKAAELRPDDVEVLVSHADAIVTAAEPAPPPAAELKPVVDRILARDPEQPRALWLSGALALSAGDKKTAEIRWTKLLDYVDPNGVRYVELKKQLEALKQK